MKVIGLLGPAGAGKDSVATILSSLHPFGRVAFADPIRRAVSKVLNIPVPDLERFKRGVYQCGEWNLEGRHVYREIGMLMVDLVPDILVNHVELALETVHDMIVTDVRRDHEVEFLDSYQPMYIEVINPRVPTYGSHLTDQRPEVNSPVYVINNDGSYSDLICKVEALWQQEIEPYVNTHCKS